MVRKCSCIALGAVITFLLCCAVSQADKKVKIDEDTVTLFLKNGGTVSGTFLRKAPNGYLLFYEGGEVLFFDKEVERMERGVAAEDKTALPYDSEIISGGQGWPYKNDVVVRLNNTAVLDAEIVKAGPSAVTLLYPAEGGGSIEQDIKRQDIEYLLFKPVLNNTSDKIYSDLSKLFPKMSTYHEGDHTILTDSYITWVRASRSAIRAVHTCIYLENLALFKGREPSCQNYVVIFDDYLDFIEHAVADGVPGWAVLGYFDPKRKVLYSFNALGDKMSDFIFEAIVGKSTKEIDKWEDTVKGRVGSDRYDIVIEGIADDIKDKIWRYYSIVQGQLREMSLNTLRHEFTHELYSNWNLQNIMVSRKETGYDEDVIEAKRKFLETDNIEEKRKLLVELMGIRQEEAMPDLMAANSWLAEGVATYYETAEPGAMNKRWFYLFQQMVKKQSFFPLEHLMVYKIGSFPGVYPKAMLGAYAQSWAFVKFLNDKYHDEFIEYQERVSGQKMEGSDDVKWLIEALGKDLRALQAEFVNYMATFKKIEDPFIEDFEKIYMIFNEFK